MVLPLSQYCHLSWVEICKKVKKAVVYIDNNAAECLHWNGGLMEIISAGAIAVKEFSLFECASEYQKKAVFITCSPIIGTTRTVLREIIKGSSFEYCVVITAAHSSVLQFAKYGHCDPTKEMSVLHYLEQDILMWMGDANYTVEIFYFPLFAVPVTETLFLTPAFSELFPILESDLLDLKKWYAESFKTDEKQCFGSLSSLELSVLPSSLQTNINYFVSCFHSLFAQWNMREDLFSLGPFSGLLATELENLPPAVKRRKTASNRCSLILVDRTLDLSSTNMYDTDCLLDKILTVLPRLPGHSNDVAVNMSPLCNAQVNSVNENILAPGCLAHPKSESCTEVLEWLFRKKQKDILLGIHHNLIKESPTSGTEKGSKLIARVSAQALEKQIVYFKGHMEKISQCSGLLQQALAVTQTLKSPRITQLEVLASIEKLLLQNLTASNDGSPLITQINQLLNTRSERELELKDLLGILVHMYSLAGCGVKFAEQAERQLENVLHKCFIEEKDNPSSRLSTIFHPDVSDNEFETLIHNFLNGLKSIANARKELSKYRSLLKYHLSEPVERIALLQQLVSDIFEPSKPAIPDLSCKSTGLKDLIKTGFSFLMNLPPQIHPADNPVVIVFVVGGVTAREVRLIEETVSHRKQGVQILVGSTRLVTPGDIVDTLLARNLLL